jgi:hypothetical protein
MLCCAIQTWGIPSGDSGVRGGVTSKQGERRFMVFNMGCLEIKIFLAYDRKTPKKIYKQAIAKLQCRT